jgi:transposase
MVTNQCGIPLFIQAHPGNKSDKKTIIETIENLLDNHFKLNAQDLIFVELDSLPCKRVRRRELCIQEAIYIDTKVRSMPIQAYSTPTLRQGYLS